MSVKFEEKEEKSICDRYKKGQTINALSRKFKHGDGVIKAFLVKNRIKIRGILESRSRKYSHDENFFAKINNEKKAYWLGFLYGDGCIAKYSVNLNLNRRDLNHLKKFKKDLKFTGKIELTNRLINYGGKYGKKRSKMGLIRIQGVKIRQDLRKLGCTPRKTFTVRFPSFEQVPKNLIRHFIRGIFDADGSVWKKKYVAKNKKKRGVATITGTDSIINGIKSFLVLNVGMLPNSVFVCGHPNSVGISIMTVCSTKAMFLFRKFLYKGATVFLKRKKRKFFSFEMDAGGFNWERAKIQIINLLKKRDSICFKDLEKTVRNLTFKRAIKELLKEGKVEFSHSVGTGGLKFFKVKND